MEGRLRINWVGMAAGVVTLLGAAFESHAFTLLSVTNNGSSAYIIDGQSNPSLDLIRGDTYSFVINTPNHPFYVKTAQETGSGSAYTNGVTGNGTTVGILTFTVPMDAPDTLYYICSSHSSMKGAINISHPPIREVARVFNGAGGTASNLNRRSVIAALQPNPVGFSSNSKFLNSAGFLHGDSPVGSSTADTDQDGLSDWDEITGRASTPLASSNPNEADTDGDGVSDGDEINAGTNPADADSLLEIIFTGMVDGNWEILWESRGGFSYSLYSAGTIPDLNTNPTLVAEITASGGTPPWSRTVTSYTNATTGQRYYKIQTP